MQQKDTIRTTEVLDQVEDFAKTLKEIVDGYFAVTEEDRAILDRISLDLSE